MTEYLAKMSGISVWTWWTYFEEKIWSFKFDI